VEDVIDMCEQGLISPHISAEFDLEKVNEAFEFLKERRSTGKVILDCDWIGKIAVK
jgi:D-arabinose 1-dehydrogenase-like Zn-dependent alcohol dehydrogenase